MTDLDDYIPEQSKTSKLELCPDCGELALNIYKGICLNPDCDQIPF